MAPGTQKPLLEHSCCSALKWGVSVSCPYCSQGVCVLQSSPTLKSTESPPIQKESELNNREFFKSMARRLDSYQKLLTESTLIVRNRFPNSFIFNSDSLNYEEQEVKKIVRLAVDAARMLRLSRDLWQQLPSRLNSSTYTEDSDLLTNG